MLSENKELEEGVRLSDNLYMKEQLSGTWNKALEKAVEIVLESDLVSKQVKDNLVGKIKSHTK